MRFVPRFKRRSVDGFARDSASACGFADRSTVTTHERHARGHLTLLHRRWIGETQRECGLA
jgi:hypothetical protein